MKSKYKTNKEQVRSMASNPDKGYIRSDIAHQVITYMCSAWQTLYKTTGCKLFSALTLPGGDWLFEKELNRALSRHTGIAIRPEVRIQGVDRDHAVMRGAIVNRPDNCTLAKCELDDFLRNDYCASSGHISRALLKPRKLPIKFDLIFGDFCLNPSVTILRRAAEILVTNIDQGMGYFTFCLQPGQRLGNAYLLSLFRKYSRADNIQDAVVDTLNRFIYEATDRPVFLVYSVVYAGNGGIVPMLTLGYTVGLKVPTVPIIREDQMTMERVGKHKKEVMADYMCAKKGAWTHSSCSRRKNKL